VAGARTKTIDGVKHLSLQGVTDQAGVSKRTGQRAQAKGRLPRAKLVISKPGAIKAGQEQWFTPEEVAQAVQILSKEKERQQQAREQAQDKAPPRRPWMGETKNAQPPKRWGQVQGLEPEETEPELPAPETCPHCHAKGSIVTWINPIPGARTEFGEQVICEQCGKRVEVEPEPPAQSEKWGTWGSWGARGSGEGQHTGFPATMFPPSSTSSARRRPAPLMPWDVQAVRRAPKPAHPVFERPLDPLG
jgi:hypothetical protein